MISSFEEENYFKKYRLIRWFALDALIIMFSALLLVFTPTLKEAAVIYLLPKVVNNEQVQELPENALKLLNGKMNQWMDEQLGLNDK
jgi:hypothetical protein